MFSFCSTRTLAAIGAAACLALPACTTSKPSLGESDAEYTVLPRKAGPAGILAGNSHEIAFHPISLVSSGKYTFRLEELPPELLHATLTLDDPTEAKLDMIDQAGVRARFSVINLQTGEESVKEGRLLGDWPQTTQSWDGSVTDFDAIWFRAKRRQAYEVEVEIEVAKPVTGQVVTATPRLINSDKRVP